MANGKINLRVLSACALMSFFVNTSAMAQATQRITLDEAQARAAGAGRDIAQLGIDAARYHREAAQADYFPKIDSTFVNLHFNKFMGETVQLARRRAEFPLLSKDPTTLAFTLTQPVTPLLKVHEAVKIARADEAIATAMAAQSIARNAADVEQTFLALLIAQRRQTAAVARIQRIGAGFESGTQLIQAKSRVMELTQSLNTLLGFAPDTDLDLVPPEPALHTISLPEATQQALAASPEIIAAEQTIVKAKAAARLSKLEYVPDVAVIGGYLYETAIPVLPRDFSYVGVMASLNIYDFGKREKAARERNAQVAMAEANLALVKAKLTARVQKSVLEVQRTREIRDIARQLNVTNPLVSVSYGSLNSKPDWAEVEADMFQTELDYRVASYALKRVIDGQ